MSKQNTKVPAEPCIPAEITRAPTRAWQGSFDGADEGASMAGGTSMRRKVGTDYDKSGEAERELPPIDEAYPAPSRFGLGG